MISIYGNLTPFLLDLPALRQVDKKLEICYGSLIRGCGSLDEQAAMMNYILCNNNRGRILSPRPYGDSRWMSKIQRISFAFEISIPAAETAQGTTQ